MDPEKQLYLAGYKEGYLWKRGKDDKKFQRRRFVLSETDNTLKYYNREDVSFEHLVSVCIAFPPSYTGKGTQSYHALR
jgi:hypothetical protein